MTLIQTIKIHYKKHGRTHLPWRQTPDPYKILVSEMMLQQTQVDRVLPKYTAFIKTFPTVKALAGASFPQVLSLWSGLGYNRRAKFLHEAAKTVMGKCGGKLPKDVSELEKLPGIGPYTARAVAAFAYNEPVVFIETNIRTVFIHSHIRNLPDQPAGKMKIDQKISDLEILPLVEKMLKESKMEPRDFYAALMDYGTFLKQSGVRNNSQSKHYTKQTKFKGSARELRGALLRELLKAPATKQNLITTIAKEIQVERVESERIELEINKLLKENLIQKKGKLFAIKE